MYWIETIVCSVKPEVRARLQRNLNTRQEYKRRQSGCIAAWNAIAADNANMFLIQTIFRSADHWKAISELTQSQFDKTDGGIEQFLIGPPLVGVFEVEESQVGL